jgi:DNA topoisomerase-1
LEKENLGTKATRASIVDSLKSRGYTLSDRFDLSTLGYATYETLGDFMPKMLSSEFTRALELEMEAIQAGTRQREEVLREVKNDLIELLTHFQGQEQKIGEALIAGLQRFWKEKQELGTCPTCGTGKLVIIRSQKTGKRFIGCTNYKEGHCEQTYPLPQRGEIVPLEKTCEYCGHPMFKVISGRRRVWETCVNWTTCPGRVDELKAWEEKRRKMDSKKQESESND